MTPPSPTHHTHCTDTTDTPKGAPHREPDLWSALLHRWWVEYNPLPLASAALVLAGLTVLARELAGEPSGVGALGVAAVAEVYALALIGGAAFLMRLGHRRSAAILGLLAVLWQGDLTLHVETCAYLGGLGWLASAGWLALFVAKLLLLARALELRLSRSAWLVPVAGAFGVALIPHLMRELDPTQRGHLVSLFVFGLGTAAVWTERAVTSVDPSGAPMDPRAVRSIRACWGLLAVFTLAHVLHWSTEHRFSLAGLLPALLFLVPRWRLSEQALTIAWVVGLALVGAIAPQLLAPTALMAAVVMVLRALRAPAEGVSPGAPRAPAPPYRSHRAGEAKAPLAPPERLATVGPAVRRRQLVRALASLYVAAWTYGWSGGSLPDHHLALDLLLALGCVYAAWEARRPLSLAPIALAGLHFGAQTGALRLPSSGLQWGASSVGLGFGCLLAFLAVSWWRARDVPRDDADASQADASLTSHGGGA